MNFFKTLIFVYISIVVTVNAFDKTIQHQVQLALKHSYEKLHPNAIMLMILNNHTGKSELISNIGDINKTDVQKFLFEPGSAIFPFVIATALESNTTKPDDTFIYEKLDKTYNIKIKDKISTQKIMTLHNTKAIATIASKLSADELYNSLISFGLNQKLREKERYKHKRMRISTSFGYGLLVSFEKLLQAYGIFANNGKNIKDNSTVLSSKNAHNIKNMLIDVVNNGSGNLAKREKLTIGGKTATVHRIENARYSNKMYNSLFYGFVEDQSNNSYSIGVMILNPKNKYSASKTAVPLCGNIIDILVNNKILK